MPTQFARKCALLPTDVEEVKFIMDAVSEEVRVTSEGAVYTVCTVTDWTGTTRIEMRATDSKG